MKYNRQFINDKTNHPQASKSFKITTAETKNINFIDSGLLKLVSPQDPLNRLFTKGSEKRHSGSQSVFNKISSALITARCGFF